MALLTRREAEALLKELDSLAALCGPLPATLARLRNGIREDLVRSTPTSRIINAGTLVDDVEPGP